MSSTVKDVRTKLDEYGIDIYSEYPMDKEYCIQTEHMMLFIKDDDASVCISFRADLRPEDTSNYVLILGEIESLKSIDVAESFAFDRNNNFITGESAFEYIREDIISHAIHECVKEQTYSQILQTTKCFNC